MNKLFEQAKRERHEMSRVEATHNSSGLVTGYKPQTASLTKALTVRSNSNYNAMGGQVRKKIEELRDQILREQINALGIQLTTREMFMLGENLSNIQNILHNHGYKVDIVSNGDGTESIRIYQLVREIRLSAEVSVRAEEI